MSEQHQARSLHTDTAPSSLFSTSTTNATLAGSSPPSRYQDAASPAYDVATSNINTDNGSSTIQRNTMSSRSYEYQAARLATSSHRPTHAHASHSLSTMHIHSAHSLSRSTHIRHTPHTPIYNFDDESLIEGSLNTHNNNSNNKNNNNNNNNKGQQRLANLVVSNDLNDDHCSDLKPQSALSDRDDDLRYHRYSDEDSGNNDDEDDSMSHTGDDDLTGVDENNNAIDENDNSQSEDGNRVQAAQLTSVIMSTSSSVEVETDEGEIPDAGDDKLDDKKKPYGGRPLKFVCDKCDRRFHAPSHLKRHMLCHSTERPYKCQVCGKGFLQAWHLGRHMTTHTGNKPFQCSQCPKSFGSRFEMNTHYNYIHKGIKEHQCKVCNKHFTLRSNLKVHMRKHTGEKPYSCHICKKKFGQRGHLQYHLQKHIRDRGLMLSTGAEANNPIKQMSDLKSLPPLPPMLTAGTYPNPPSIESDSGVESLGSPKSGDSYRLGSPHNLTSAYSPMSVRSGRERSTSLSSSQGSPNELEGPAYEQLHEQKMVADKKLKKTWVTTQECCNDQPAKPLTYNGSSTNSRLPEFPKLFMSRQGNSYYHGSTDHRHEEIMPTRAGKQPTTDVEASYSYLQKQCYASQPRDSAFYDSTLNRLDYRSPHATGEMYSSSAGGYSCCTGIVGGSHFPNSSATPEKLSNAKLEKSVSYPAPIGQSHHMSHQDQPTSFSSSIPATRSHVSCIASRKRTSSPSTNSPRRDHFSGFYDSASAALAAMSNHHHRDQVSSKSANKGTSLLPPPVPSAFKSAELYDKYLSQLERYYGLLRMQMGHGGSVPLPPMPLLPPGEFDTRGQPVALSSTSSYNVTVPSGNPHSSTPMALVKQEQPPAVKKFRGISDILMDARCGTTVLSSKQAVRASTVIIE